MQDRELDLVLTIPESYPKDFSAGRTAHLELTIDASHNRAQASVRRVEHLLRAYGEELGALRLVARGVSPVLAAPVAVEEVDLATPEKMAAFALGMIPMFLLMTAFIGGMYLAIDATAGERERGSLEPLLLNPVSRADLVMGKWAAVVITATAALAIAAAAFGVALRYVPLQELGLRVDLGTPQLALGAAVLLPLVLAAAALEMLVALFARTYKEAQTYVSLMLLVPTLPASMLALAPVKAQTWMMLIPLWGQALLLQDVVSGVPVPALRLGLAALASVALTVLCLRLAVRFLGREATVFGRTQAGA